ncbi:MAG: hypothetical protein HeimC3_31440 [Candidatus Heimdallarchaeota archaeon LC_3]|nr:MAG: hypothetical protein HeimC3_31440 [Candidatus Heimdallarchaeota archaeon LC_3]
MELFLENHQSNLVLVKITKGNYYYFAKTLVIKREN